MKEPQIPETSADRFARLAPSTSSVPAAPQRRKCAGITKAGERCGAWAVTGRDMCAGHLKLVPLDSAQGVEARREKAEQRRKARLSLADRLTQELESDADALVSALKRGVRSSSETVAVRSAQAWVQLIYGRQLQGKGDEAGSDLDVMSMSAQERDQLKARLVRENPALAAEILGNVS